MYSESPLIPRSSWKPSMTMISVFVLLFVLSLCWYRFRFIFLMQNISTRHFFSRYTRFLSVELVDVKALHIQFHLIHLESGILSTWIHSAIKHHWFNKCVQHLRHMLYAIQQTLSYTKSKSHNLRKMEWRRDPTDCF